MTIANAANRCEYNVSISQSFRSYDLIHSKQSFDLPKQDFVDFSKVYVLDSVLGN